MERKNVIDPMFKLDDFFTSQEERDEQKKEKIEELELSLLDTFKNHPFKVINNEDLNKLKESINVNGVLEPIIVRKYASELLGLKTIPCIIRDMTDDEATIYMVDSNMHRETILPSEKAKAYKMKLDALNHQGKASGQVVQKLDSRDKVGEEAGESGRQVNRFIRLNELIPELLDKVDNKEIAFNPAVEISYLSKSEQEMLLEAMDYSDATPSHAQTIILKKLSQDGKLTNEKIMDMMSEEKPNQKSKIKISEDKLRSAIPKSVRVDNYEDFIFKAIDYYSKHLEKAKSYER